MIQGRPDHLLNMEDMDMSASGAESLLIEEWSRMNYEV